MQSRNKREDGEKREGLGNEEEKNTQIVGELENETNELITLKVLLEDR